jgi:hypothetical protein
MAPAAAGRSGIAMRPVRRAESQWLRVAMWVLGILATAEATWLVIRLLIPLPEFSVPPLPAGNGAGTDVEAPAIEDMPSLAASAAPGVFASLAPDPEAAGAQVGTPSATATQLSARLSLMGIVAGNPSQAIIEDSQTQKTYFVSVGQPVVEGAVVEQVLDNRVVLKLGGEKIELSL